MNTDVRKLYLEAFGNEEGFDKRLFDAFGNIIECEYSNGSPVSILFPLPCTLVLEEKQIPAKYIFAATTDSKHRSKGYMSRLIERVCKDADTFFFLRPATPSLIDYYSKLGFKTVYGFGNGGALPKIEVTHIHRSLAGGVPEGGEFTLMYRYSKPLDIKKLHFGYSML